MLFECIRIFNDLNCFCTNLIVSIRSCNGYCNCFLLFKHAWRLIGCEVIFVLNILILYLFVLNHLNVTNFWSRIFVDVILNWQWAIMRSYIKLLNQFLVELESVACIYFVFYHPEVTNFTSTNIICSYLKSTMSCSKKLY